LIGEESSTYKMGAATFAGKIEEVKMLAPRPTKRGN